MVEQLIRKFDRKQWLTVKGFLARTTLFLDLNFWIGMSEGREQSYIELRSLLSQKVAENKIVCPISPTLLLELKKRPGDEKRSQYCELMDELSQGLSIRNWLSTFKDEFKNVVEGQPINSQVAYSHFVEAFSAGMQVVFDETWSELDADEASNLIFNHIDNLPISEMVAIDVDENEKGSIRFFRNGLSRITQEEKAWRQSHSDSRNTIEQAEFAATVRAVLPQILNSSVEIAPLAFETLLITSSEEKAETLKQCPTFWCHYQLMTALRSNREKLKENDLWDLEHAASALPYVNCFACDSGTRHLCSEVMKLDDKYGTVVVSKLDDLLEWIKTTVS